MSMREVEQIVAELPYSLREDILGYAHSVEAALPEIFRAAGLRPEDSIAEEIILISGIRKLHAIATANFWILENSLHLAGSSRLGKITIAGRSFDRQSPYYKALSELVTEFDYLVESLNLREYLDMNSYADLARALSHGRQGR